MTSTTESTRIYWIYAILSLAGVVAFLLIKPEWFWVMLPPLLTYFIKGMRWM